jgi:hypothetical protein
VTWAGLELMPSWGMMSCTRMEIYLLLGLQICDLGRTEAHAQFGQDVLCEPGDLVIARSIVL